MTFQFQPKKQGLEALLGKQKDEEAQIKALQTKHKSTEVEKPFEYKSPEKATDKIRIIFDDSGSMSGQKIKDAIDGTIEFMRNCVLNQTAVAVHPMNYKAVDTTAITTNLPAMAVLIAQIRTTGSTPMFQTWEKALYSEPKATRYIIFSDGQPDNIIGKEECISKCIEDKTPCDTVYITNNSLLDDSELLKEIAERTGGLYLKFDRSKVNFKTAFKYLAPVLRLQLAASVEMQKNLQEGKLK